MTTEHPIIIPGIVQDGKVVPQSTTELPDGAHVKIVLGHSHFTPELEAELKQWEQASDEAWAMIDLWEEEDS